MESCDAVLEAVKSFEGSALIVTHDEYFLRNVATSLIVTNGNRTYLFESGYDDFLKGMKDGWNGK
jgi:ATP-binding cassette subfamily F protein 3